MLKRLSVLADYPTSHHHHHHSRTHQEEVYPSLCLDTYSAAMEPAVAAEGACIHHSQDWPCVCRHGLCLVGAVRHENVYLPSVVLSLYHSGCRLDWCLCLESGPGHFPLFLPWEVACGQGCVFEERATSSAGICL